MKPITPFDSYPSFANGGSRSAPGDAKYALGFVPADTFPAEWANYFFHGATKGVSDLNSAVISLWNEMGSVLSNYNITPDATDNDQLLECLTKLKAEAALAAHPVGSLYWTSVNENPATTFGGGTWEQIKDKFILAAGDTYSQGATGGSATVTLTEAQMPVHSHETNSLTNSSGTEITTTGTQSANPNFYGTKVSASFGGVMGSGQNGAAISKLSVTAPFSYDKSLSGADYICNWASGVGSNFYNCKFNYTPAGSLSGNHTHNFEHKHGTTTAGGLNGTTQAHDNMPPYIVQYCWKRVS